jgi:hypothetical protein
MPSTAKPVVTVEESLTLSNGKSPVRINQSPSKSIPRFLPAKLFVSAIRSPFVEMRLMNQSLNSFFKAAVQLRTTVIGNWLTSPTGEFTRKR